MKKSVLFSAMGVLAACGAAVQAEEIGRVISSTPVIQQVAVPRQVCADQPVVVQQPSSGGGALLGAIVGGIVGNQIGHGMGRAAATGIGAIAGAAVGDNVEGRGYQTQYAQQCSTQTWYENRTTGYNVVYEYAGKEYHVQLPYDPGPSIRLQVTPVGANPPPPAEAVGTNPPGIPLGTIVGPPMGQPMVVAPRSVYPAVYPAAYPTVYPGYYQRPYYYPPVGISLNFGYTSGHRHHRRGHWR